MGSTIASTASQDHSPDQTKDQPKDRQTSSAADAFKQPLSAALHHALAHLHATEFEPVAPTATLETLRSRLALPLNSAGIDPAQVVEELVEGSRGGIVGSAGPRFFGWVIGGSLPAALAADWLTSTWDQNAALYAAGPAAAIVEETAGNWLKDLLNIPSSASFAFVTGCQMAHVTSIAAARHALLARRGWDVEQQGLSGAPAIRVLSSSEYHHTFLRAIRYLGLGEKNFNSLPADPEGRLPAETLAAALAEEPERPTIVLLQAGDLNLGAFDDFASLIPIAHQAGAWVHVDGAFGLWAAASPRHQHLLRGAEAADSWATDGHKWLNVPYDCGYAFVAHPADHQAATSMRASYLTQGVASRDQLDWTPEFSRRGRGFATYAALRQLGREGVADLIDRCCHHTLALATGIGSLEGAQLVWKPQINQGLIRFLSPQPEASETDHDVFTDGVIAAILGDGQAFFTGTSWRGRRAMRISVCNWQTSDADIQRVIESVRKVLAEARKRP